MVSDERLKYVPRTEEEKTQRIIREFVREELAWIPDFLQKEYKMTLKEIRTLIR